MASRCGGESGGESMPAIGWLVAGMLAAGAPRGAGGDAHWPQWRGADGRGVSAATGLPIEFSPQKNLVWKVELPGRSSATPALWGDRLFLSSPDGGDLYLYCVSTGGEVLWRRKVGAGDRTLGFNSKNNFATPSLMTDGARVWISVGSGDLACFDFEGNEIWARSIVKDHGPITNDFGLGSTPLLWRDWIFYPCIHRRAESYLLAIDKNTGKDVWKTFRPTSAEEESRDGYSSPAIIEPEGGRPELILCAADMATAYDPFTGKELWRHGEINLRGDKTLRIIVTPVATRELVYVTSAKRGPVHAIRPGGEGDVTKTHRVWTRLEHTPDVATPAVYGDLFFMIQERGVASCLDAKTGKEYWSQRVAAGYFGASPLVAEGRVYLTSEEGKVYVLAAAKEYKLLAKNDLGDAILSSPVPAPGRLYFRTEHALMCFGQ